MKRTRRWSATLVIVAGSLLFWLACGGGGSIQGGGGETTSGGGEQEEPAPGSAGLLTGTIEDPSTVISASIAADISYDPTAITVDVTLDGTSIGSCSIDAAALTYRCDLTLLPAVGDVLLVSAGPMRSYCTVESVEGDTIACGETSVGTTLAYHAVEAAGASASISPAISPALSEEGSSVYLFFFGLFDELVIFEIDGTTFMDALATFAENALSESATESAPFDAFVAGVWAKRDAIVDDAAAVMFALASLDADIVTSDAFGTFLDLALGGEGQDERIFNAGIYVGMTLDLGSVVSIEQFLDYEGLGVSYEEYIANFNEALSRIRADIDMKTMNSPSAMRGRKAMNKAVAFMWQVLQDPEMTGGIETVPGDLVMLKSISACVLETDVIATIDESQTSDMMDGAAAEWIPIIFGQDGGQFMTDNPDAQPCLLDAMQANTETNFPQEMLGQVLPTHAIMTLYHAGRYTTTGGGGGGDIDPEIQQLLGTWEQQSAENCTNVYTLGGDIEAGLAQAGDSEILLSFTTAAEASQVFDDAAIPIVATTMQDMDVYASSPPMSFTHGLTGWDEGQDQGCAFIFMNEGNVLSIACEMGGGEDTCVVEYAKEGGGGGSGDDDDNYLMSRWSERTEGAWDGDACTDFPTPPYFDDGVNFYGFGTCMAHSGDIPDELQVGNQVSVSLGSALYDGGGCSGSATNWPLIADDAQDNIITMNIVSDTLWEAVGGRVYTLNNPADENPAYDDWSALQCSIYFDSLNDEAFLAFVCRNEVAGGNVCYKYYDRDSGE